MGTQEIENLVTPIAIDRGSWSLILFLDLNLGGYMNSLATGGSWQRLLCFLEAM